MTNVHLSEYLYMPTINSQTRSHGGSNLGVGLKNKNLKKNFY